MKRPASALFAFLLALCFTACSPNTIQTSPETKIENTPVASVSDKAIEFADVNLERMIRAQLQKPEGDITISDAEAVTELHLNQAEDAPDSEKIQDISPLKYFKNVKKLDIFNNMIKDISVLSNLSNLEELEAPKNRITDISALSGLTNLRHAVFWQNQISDLKPVAGLTNLEVFSVTDNRVTDVSPLKDLTKLSCLELRGNYIIDFSPITDILQNITVTDGFQVIQPEDKIFFSDPVLEERVRETINKPTGDITVADALKVTELDLPNEWQENIPYEMQIHDISPLMYFCNLFKLSLPNHAISDISAVSYMPNLSILDLNDSREYDLSPVSNLHNLKMLNISGWRGSDLSPLSELTQLDELNISYTQVVNIEPLAGLSNLNALFAEAPIKDFTPISKLKNLKSLYVMAAFEDKYNPDLSPLKDIYPNLTNKNFEM
ncbi:Internalin-A [bioreactor metagenome]|uniref:Internalin-A n=1 Tax=bioreactor metagenome TaxID=1076179 RepID=A0A645A6L6_9ZZZZ